MFISLEDLDVLNKQKQESLKYLSFFEFKKLFLFEYIQSPAFCAIEPSLFNLKLVFHRHNVISERNAPELGVALSQHTWPTVVKTTN